MRKIFVTLCTLALSIAGTIGANQLASNDEVIIDRVTEQVNIVQDAEAAEDINHLSADVEKIEVTEKNEDKASEPEAATPKAEDAKKKPSVSIKEEKEDKLDKKEKKEAVKNYDKTDNKKSINKKAITNKDVKQNVNKDTINQNDNVSSAANNTSKNKASDYINNFKSNGNNAYLYKNVDLSNCNTTQDVVEKLQENGYKNINMNNIQNINSLEDILSLIGEKESQEDTNKPNPTTIPTKPIPSKPIPTKPAPTVAPAKPSPTKAPTKPAPTTPPTNTPSNDQSFANEVLRLVNIERSKAGLLSLTTNASLKAAADKRAQETEISFSHTRPNGSKFSTALKEYGVSYRTAGENIAYGQRSPQEVVNGWMNSPGHRANILNGSFDKIGIGVYQSKGVIYWSQLFTD